ncbi:MAG: hypothetical protein QMD65_02110 [Patescibacteria group bacterium]|nr:hypothetical protein [Patescibacteria group bacterium]
MSYVRIIIKYLKSIYESVGDKDLAWVRGYKLQSAQTSFGWLGASGMRRARELARKGLIEGRIKDGYVEYRYLPLKPKTEEELRAEAEERLILSMM